MTFGLDRQAVDTTTEMSMESWTACEFYSGNLVYKGSHIICTLTMDQILYHKIRGQWTRAGHTSIGMDRTVWNGQDLRGYPPEIASLYDKIETTLDNLLLWFHHVPYTQDSSLQRRSFSISMMHTTGAATAQTFRTEWEPLRDKSTKR